MPQFDIYLRNGVQWGFRTLCARSAREALKKAERLIKEGPAGFQLFYNGEFSKAVKEMWACRHDSNEALAMWRRRKREPRR
jgi:hypothetical protein